jgi:hypothetical protein
LAADWFAPNLAVLADNTLVVSFYEMTPPASGDNVKAMIGIRSPSSGEWRIEETDVGWSFDLNQAPHKVFQGENARFIGDYNTFTGGLTHVHYMRPAPRTTGTATPLRTFAISEACFQP